MSFVGILDAAVAGTLRQPPPPAPTDVGEAEPEARLLRAAAFYGLRRLAGRPVDRHEAPVETRPAPPEARQEIPAAASARLVALLEDRDELLPEWLRLAEEQHLRVPYTLLPVLLDYARDDIQLRPLIQAVGGERMAWLAALNPDWAFAAHIDAEKRFAEGTREERLAAFRQIRSRDPQRARDLLQEAWSTERGDTRAALVHALSHQLSNADEPVLELGLRAPRKEVREMAARLLRRLPHSGFARRWTARARSILQVHSGYVAVEVPASAPVEWIADGLDPQPPKGIGAHAWLLQQTVSFAPPATWPLGMFEAFSRSDWARPVLSGLDQAAISYRDADWCARLVIAWAHALERGLNDERPFDGPALFEVLDQPRAEAVFRRVLDIGTGAAALVGVRDDEWSLEFSRFILRKLPDLVGRWRYAGVGLLRDASLRLHPAVTGDAVRRFEAMLEQPWALPSLDRLVTTLELRTTIRGELGIEAPR